VDLPMSLTQVTNLGAHVGYLGRAPADERCSVRGWCPTRPRDRACDRRPWNSRASDARCCADAIPARHAPSSTPA
jgi:hypothetical protein